MKSVVRACIGFFASVVMQVASAHFPQQPPHQIADLGPMTFEKGGSIDNLRMSYVTHGTLNATKDNAILAIHGFAANHHAFDHLIGPGRALDPDKYFIVCPDLLGATQTGYEHSSSPTSSGLKMAFPAYNLRDMNLATHRLLTEKLGIRRLRLVTGISSGGQEAMQYAITHPGFMDAIAPISGSAMWSTQALYVTSIRMSMIETCAGWNDGNYDANPKTCATNALFIDTPLHYTRDWWQQYIDSPEAYDRWRRNWGEAYFDVQDARDLYYRERSFGESSPGDTPGFKDLDAALAAIKARTLFIYNPRDANSTPQQWAAQLKAVRGSRAVAIDSPAGHLICCNGDPNATRKVDRALKGLLSELDAAGKLRK